ncbi:MAG TPA: S41 family peptidase [Chitinophagaceae bacterium]|nr:S41 family peptidase [Chitinophagaceae bacterium]
MRKLITALLLFSASAIVAQENPLWLRYPAISPDAKTVVFSYQGDLYKVPASGGAATPLTLHEAYDYMPVWSHDGKWIAFASDRYGNFDIYVMPSSGGEAKRLTFYSGVDLPWDFSPDNKSILFSSNRIDLVTNAQIPGAGMNELYSVPVQGGRATQVMTQPAINARYNSSGDKIIFHDYKGYEDNWRKHHTSSVTRDVWVYDLKTKKYNQLTKFDGEDRNPVFSSNNNDFYYLSEASGSFNIYKSSLNNPASTTPLTKMTKHPVRFLTTADNNTICFNYDGEIYTMKEGEKPEKLAVTIQLDGRSNQEKILPVNAGITEMSVSPNGKEVVFVVRGEVFVSSVEGGITKRITNTPTQERTASFSPDGRSIIYAAERNNNWNIYTSSITRKEEPYFYASTVLKETPIVATDKEEFQPLYSPDGKEVAYLEERTTLKVFNLADKQDRTIVTADKNYSYADGDLAFDWSPDNKWLVTSYMTGLGFVRDVGIIQSDGKGKLINLTQSGYADVRPNFSKDGKMIYWYSDRDGFRGQNTQPASGDIYGVFLTQEALDRYQLSKEDFALLKEQEEKDKKKDSSKADKEVKPIKIEWDNINDRRVRLTTHTSAMSDALINNNNDKLYYLARFETGADLWMTDLRTKETKLVSKLDANQAGLDFSKDGKSLFIVANGKITKMDPESGKKDNVTINGEMIHDAGGERAYVFEHAWRQVKKKFYVPDLHGVDWTNYYNEYKKFLPYIRNNYDFADMLGEMLGELNASHTGCRYSPPQVNTDATAALAIFIDPYFNGKGLKITEVVDKGPLDKNVSKIRAGHIIEAIDGIDLVPEKDFYQTLNRKAGKLTLLSVYDPETKSRWEETVKPITLGEENELLYRRWVENRRKETERLSGGRIGYVHVRGMNDPSMRVVIDEVLGKNLEKEAIVVDTRFNGGGNLHEQLSDFLSGKKYFDVIPHGQQIGYQPQGKWIKPSIVLMGESNYSDAHLFPVAYKLKNLGQTVGMPVPGTGTFVWWETQIDPTLVFGIPQGGWRMPDGKFCENTQLEPDIKIKNDPELMSAGKDQQLEKAVQELLKGLGKKGV